MLSSFFSSFRKKAPQVNKSPTPEENLRNFSIFDRNEHELDYFANEFFVFARTKCSSLGIERVKSIFSTLFKNDDLVLYESIPEYLKTNSDWDSYVAALYRVFHPSPESICAAQKELEQLSQLRNESVYTFRRRVVKCALIAYPFDHLTCADAMAEQFLHGLKPSFRKKILTNYEVESLEEVYPLALLFEQIENETQREYREDEEKEDLVLQVNAISMNVFSYVFSEAQAGKGDADRGISVHKTKLRSQVDSKFNARNAKEIVHALNSGTPLQATTIHEIVITANKVSESKITGINSFGSYRFEKNGIRAWKHDGIGEGVFFPEKKISKNDYEYKILSEGKSDEYWKKFDSKEAKDVRSEKKPAKDLNGKKGGIFTCPDRLCVCEYLYLEGLQKHLLKGIHDRRAGTESTNDAGVRLWANRIQTDAAASLSVKSDTLAPLVPNDPKLPALGWAMKSRETASPMTSKVHEFVKKYFRDQREQGLRALARDIYERIREDKGKDGEYLFSLFDCPKESQCQSLISSLLEDEPKKKKKGSKKSKKSNETEAPAEESSDDELPTTSRNARATQNTLKRKKGAGSAKSLLKKARVKIFEEDEVAEMMEEIDESIDKDEAIKDLFRD